MKLLPLFLFLFVNALAQKKITGNYRDYFGSRIFLYSDSTFKYTWHFDMQSSWTKGIWGIKEDTVYFKMLPVYDTILIKDSHGISKDSLILSQDENPERIFAESAHSTSVNLQSTELIPKIYVDNPSLLLSSGGQNKNLYIDKLIFKRGKLYCIVNGKPYKKKEKGVWSKKKWPTWYIKVND